MELQQCATADVPTHSPMVAFFCSRDRQIPTVMHAASHYRERLSELGMCAVHELGVPATLDEERITG